MPSVSRQSAQTFPGPAPNSRLSSAIYGVSHFDPAQTDALPYTVPRGTFSIDLRKEPHVVGGPVSIMQLASTSPDYMWGVSSGGVSYIDMRDGAWREVARSDVPGVKTISLRQHEEALDQNFTNVEEVERAVKDVYGVDASRMTNGIYNVVDKDNTLYSNFEKTKIYAFQLLDQKNPATGMKIARSLDVSRFLEQGEGLVGLNMTYDGKLVIVANRSLMVTDREFRKPMTRMRFGDDEFITNSVAVDDGNGIYVASDKFMHKVVWTGENLSQREMDGAWSTPYDRGDQPPVIKFGAGTGSTPTLMGFGKDPDKLVVITDGANHMKLVAFWRDKIPENFKKKPGAKSRRIADQIQVTCGFPSHAMPKFIQSEQSVVTLGYGALVVNNVSLTGHPNSMVGVIALGPVLPPPHGVERFEWDTEEKRWRLCWARSDVVSTSMVPAVSIPSEIVLVNGYNKEHGWEITGLDWKSGATVHQTIFGHDNFGNGAYAMIQLLEPDDLLFNSITGPFRIHWNTRGLDRERLL